MIYRCSKCKKYLKRSWRSKEYKNRVWFLSYCDAKGRMTRCYKVDGRKIGSISITSNDQAIMVVSQFE